MTEILLLLCLNVKHFFIDYAWQTDKQINEKHQYLKLSGIEHSAFHAIFTYLILIHFIDIETAIILGMIDFFLHYHIDWAKMYIITKYDYTPYDRPFWIWQGFDQFLHQLTYILITAVSVIIIGEYS
jgi:hypothetical protein